MSMPESQTSIISIDLNLLPRDMLAIFIQWYLDTLDSDILNTTGKLLVLFLNLILLLNSFPILSVFWSFNSNKIHFKKKKISISSQVK